MSVIGVWRARYERFRCGRRGHDWAQRMAFGPGEIRDFAICLRCGEIDDKAHDERPGS